MKKTEKMKTWFKENEVAIISGSLAVGSVLSIGVGYLLGKKMTKLDVDYGTYMMHCKGLLKFFDPSTGVEIGMDKLGEVISKTKW